MRILDATLLSGNVLIPYAYVPEMELDIFNVPVTSITVKNYLGRRILMGGRIHLGSEVYISNPPKSDSTQPTILVVGRRGTGKSIVLRVLVESAWLAGFTPIFIVSPKNDYVNMDKPNVDDLHQLIQYHREFVKAVTSVDLYDKPTSTKKEIFTKAIKKIGFKIKILVPPRSELKDERYEYFRLNPRFLDAYQLADLMGKPTETHYIKIYDNIYSKLWKQNPLMKTEDFLRKFLALSLKASEGVPQVQNMLKMMYERLKTLWKDGLLAEDGRNQILKYYGENIIVNLNFNDEPRSLENSVIVSNFIFQVIEALRKYHLPSFLIIDDLPFFLTSMERRGVSASMQRTLDELMNILGRVSDAGIRLAIACQDLTQLRKPLNRLELYTHIFKTVPSKIVRPSYLHFETEYIDTVYGTREHMLLRPPLTAR